MDATIGMILGGMTSALAFFMLTRKKSEFCTP